MLVVRHFSISKGLILSTMRVNQVMELSDDDVKNSLKMMAISNHGFNDCSTISYTQYKNHLLYYQEEGDSMLLRATNIETNEVEELEELNQYSIKYDSEKTKVHSVIFSQDHLGEPKEATEQSLSQFLQSITLGVTFSIAGQNEMVKLLLMDTQDLKKSQEPNFKILADDTENHLSI